MMMNLAQKLWRTAHQVHPEPRLSGSLARLKYVVRGLAQPRLTSLWFDTIDTPQFASLVGQFPHILSKLQRPYLHRRLNAAGRLAALKSHYLFLAEALDDQTRDAIFAPGGLFLAELPETEAGLFSLRLFYFHGYCKEGDLCLGLFPEGAELPIFNLTFCVNTCPVRGDRELFIGGLQAQRTDNTRETIVVLTRSLHGLRPKALLVFALQRLAQAWGISRVRAVAQNEHIYRHYLKRKNFQADYDEFWNECNGRLLPDGNFELPAVPLERNLQELPRNKRPIYRRRYAMQAAIGSELAWRALGWDEHEIRALTLPEEFEGVTDLLPDHGPVLVLEDFEPAL